MVSGEWMIARHTCRLRQASLIRQGYQRRRVNPDRSSPQSWGAPSADIFTRPGSRAAMRFTGCALPQPMLSISTSTETPRE